MKEVNFLKSAKEKSLKIKRKEVVMWKKQLSEKCQRWSYRKYSGCGILIFPSESSPLFRVTRVKVKQPLH